MWHLDAVCMHPLLNIWLPSITQCWICKDLTCPRHPCPTNKATRLTTKRTYMPCLAPEQAVPVQMKELNGLIYMARRNTDSGFPACYHTESHKGTFLHKTDSHSMSSSNWKKKTNDKNPSIFICEIHVKKKKKTWQIEGAQSRKWYSRCIGKV